MRGVRNYGHRLAGEEMQLTSDIATEPQRWTAMNRRLEALEGSIAPR
jgi:hypothetical protein